MIRLASLAFLMVAGCCYERPQSAASPDWFEEGRSAGRAGLPREFNPYPEADPPSMSRTQTGYARSRWFSGHNTGVAESKKCSSE